MRYNVVLLAAAALAAVSAAPAKAREADGPPAVAVRYDDLNLSSPAGAKALLARIRSAANAVCGADPDLRDLERQSLYHSCVKDSIDRAVRQLNASQVTAAAHGAAGFEVASH